MTRGLLLCSGGAGVAGLALSGPEGCCQLYGEGPEQEGRQARAGSAPQCASPGRSLSVSFAGFPLFPSVFAHRGRCLPTPWARAQGHQCPELCFPGTKWSRSQDWPRPLRTGCRRSLSPVTYPRTKGEERSQCQAFYRWFSSISLQSAREAWPSPCCRSA